MKLGIYLKSCDGEHLRRSITNIESKDYKVSEYLVDLRDCEYIVELSNVKGYFNSVILEGIIESLGNKDCYIAPYLEKVDEDTFYRNWKYPKEMTQEEFKVERMKNADCSVSYICKNHLYTGCIHETLRFCSEFEVIGEDWWFYVE